MKIKFTLNGRSQTVDADPRETLLDVLREDLNLLGTKYGCGEGECGACSVLLNGQPVTSCLVLAGQAHGANIVTVEGLEQDAVGKHVLSAFVDLGAVQCGFCTPGMIIAARALLAENATPTLDDIQFALGGNLCRCTGYTKIIDAVFAAGESVAAQKTKVNGSKVKYGALKSNEFVRPKNLDGALALLSDGDWQIIAGCTDFAVQNEHHLKDSNVLDLSTMSELQSIGEDDDYVYIGGGTTFSTILQSPLLAKWAKPLIEAAGEIGAVQIQNRATIAGNLINASPAADSVPPLFVLDAAVTLLSGRGERVIPVSELATGPGQTVIAPDEILTAVLIPKKRSAGEEVTFFAKFGSRKAQTISMASVALRGWLENGQLSDVQIALGAVAPTVIYAPDGAAHLMAEPLTEANVIAAGNLAADACTPIDDIRASAAYRRRLVHGLLVKGLWQYVVTPA